MSAIIILEGKNVYQVVLDNSPLLTNVTAGVPIPLFSLVLPEGCSGGNIEVLTNDSNIQQSIFSNFGANFNNQMSMSIDGAPAIDIYDGNDPETDSFVCTCDDPVFVSCITDVNVTLGDECTSVITQNMVLIGNSAMHFRIPFQILGLWKAGAVVGCQGPGCSHCGPNQNPGMPTPKITPSCQKL